MTLRPAVKPSASSTAGLMPFVGSAMMRRMSLAQRASGAPLDRAFFASDAETVARALLGALLVHAPNDARDAPEMRARVVETEAYVGPEDLACHASRGRTKRTAVMFGPAGHAYVYLVYGMHDMLNVVTGPEGHPQAVLIRALEPLSGIEGRTDGPGRLTRALGVDRRYDARDLCPPPPAIAPLRFEAGAAPARIEAGPRVGVDYAGEWADAPLRFWVAGNAFVSRR